MYSPPFRWGVHARMSTKQQKASRRPRKAGRGKGRSRPRASSRPSSNPAAYTGAAMVNVREMSTLATLPRVGISTNSAITTPYGAGIRVTGLCRVGDISKTYPTYSALNTGAAGTVYTTLLVHPFYFKDSTVNSRLQNMATNWTRYRFTRIRMHYTPEVGSIETNQFALTYFQDGAVVWSQRTSGGGVSSFDYNVDSDGIVMINQPWLGAAVDFTGKLSKDWYYLDIDNDTDAGLRQSIQGGFQAAWAAATISGGDKQTGTLWAEYTIEFAQPYVQLDLVLLGASKESKKEKPLGRTSRDPELKSRSLTTGEIPSGPPARPARLPPEDPVQMLRDISARLARLERLGVPLEGETLSG